MACSASCGGRLSSQAWYSIRSACSACASCASSSVFGSASSQDGRAERAGCAAGPSPPPSPQRGEGGSSRAARTVRAMRTRSSSDRLNSGERSACASDRSCPGDTSASTSASTSRTAGSSPSTRSSGCSQAMPSARSSACSTLSGARLRASTISSRAGVPLAICAASQCAACWASRVIRVSSGSSRGSVRLSRQAGRSPLSCTFSGRSISGRAASPPVAAADSVVCGRKPA